MKATLTHITLPQLHSWFKKQKFQLAEFEKEKLYLSTNQMGQTVAFKLTQKPGFDTFYRETKEGALLVFEVQLKDGHLTYHGYCPIWLFGIWTIKLSFKKNAKWPFRYRKEGARVEGRLLDYCGDS